MLQSTWEEHFLPAGHPEVSSSQAFPCLCSGLPRGLWGEGSPAPAALSQGFPGLFSLTDALRELCPEPRESGIKFLGSIFLSTSCITRKRARCCFRSLAFFHRVQNVHGADAREGTHVLSPARGEKGRKIVWPGFNEAAGIHPTSGVPAPQLGRLGDALRLRDSPAHDTGREHLWEPGPKSHPDPVVGTAWFYTTCNPIFFCPRELCECEGRDCTFV